MPCILLINSITTHLIQKVASHHLNNGTFSNPTSFSSFSFWEKRRYYCIKTRPDTRPSKRVVEVEVLKGSLGKLGGLHAHPITCKQSHCKSLLFPQECRCLCSCFLFEFEFFSPSRRVVLLAARMFSAQKTMISEQFFQQFSSRGDITNCQF